MKKLEKLIKSMPSETGIYDETVKPPVFIGEDYHGREVIVLSAEHENSFYFADYYGEFRGGYPWINPKLEAWASERGFFWEWQNAGALSLHKI